MRRSFLTSGGESIHGFPTNVAFLGHGFTGGAHVDVVVDVPQSIVNHGVHKGGIPHFGTSTLPHEELGGVAHAFHPTGHNGFEFPCSNAVGRHHGCLEGRTADFVDGHGWCAHRQACTQGDLASRVLPCTRLKHLSKHHFINHTRCRVYVAPGKQFLDRCNPEIDGTHGGKSTHELGNWSSGNAANNRTWLAHALTKEGWPFKMSSGGSGKRWRRLDEAEPLGVAWPNSRPT